MLPSAARVVHEYERGDRISRDTHPLTVYRLILDDLSRLRAPPWPRDLDGEASEGKDDIVPYFKYGNTIISSHWN